MTINKTLVYIFLIVIYWFFCGGPNFFLHPASLGLYAIGLAYLTVILWNDQLFRFFYGDSFTYGAAGLGIALAIGLPAILIKSRRWYDDETTTSKDSTDV